ncbi:RcnB family protein [Ramlibacter albus]|uniref:RcnB family protein n=1 Tax=Ramlibacter albus TaxID=2079448 RepID=A0A923MDD5_9BURK|nr:RcnB family protein [Ramlibacter albus]MBC5767368.1 RcnB family protein [Ramlibacter albus]
MKASRFTCGVLAATLAIGCAGAFARDGDHDGDRNWDHRDSDRRGSWQQRNHRQYTPPAVTYSQPAYAQRNYYSYSQPAYTYSQPAYTYSAPRYWSRGDRLPYDWRSRYYVVNDWRSYNLYSPPAGYGWVQADTGDYLLVALATGLIANLLLNR